MNRQLSGQYIAKPADIVIAGFYTGSAQPHIEDGIFRNAADRGANRLMQRTHQPGIA
ncbi:hypothetical protein [Sulfuriferula sp. AH1]|uniref:hypothetical protein n=1 Tax=Sulfuriferula sp. AH1 TaxID=1985873 RepID=UPI0012FB7054|nr:hypothetical protein [Sulfuriferula sp. AH1]